MARRRAGPAETRGRRPRHARVASVLERFAPGRTLTPETTLDALGLSSLERVELMMALEEAFQVTVDEGTIQRRQDRRRPRRADQSARGGRTGDAGRDRRHPVPRVEPIAPRPRPAPRQPPDVDSAPRPDLRESRRARPRSPRSRGRTGDLRRQSPEPSRHAGDSRRAAARAGGTASHQPWPRNSSRRTSTRTQFSRKAYLQNSANYYLASLFFNAFPLPQRESGTRQTLRYIGELISRGYSILIYPEGRRTQKGEIARFQPGAAMIAARLEVPVVPVRLEGLDRILHQSWKFPRRGRARVTFGALCLEGNDYAEMAARIEAAVIGLAPRPATIRLSAHATSMSSSRVARPASYAVDVFAEPRQMWHNL